MKERCDTCRFWEGTLPPSVEGWGACHAEPPTMRDTGRGIWPRTHCAEGCGNWSGHGFGSGFDALQERMAALEKAHDALQERMATLERKPATAVPDPNAESEWARWAREDREHANDDGREAIETEQSEESQGEEGSRAAPAGYAVARGAPDGAAPEGDWGQGQEEQPKGAQTKEGAEAPDEQGEVDRSRHDGRGAPPEDPAAGDGTEKPEVKKAEPIGVSFVGFFCPHCKDEILLERPESWSNPQRLLDGIETRSNPGQPAYNQLWRCLNRAFLFGRKCPIGQDEVKGQNEITQEFIQALDYILKGDRGLKDVP